MRRFRLLLSLLALVLLWPNVGQAQSPIASTTNTSGKTVDQAIDKAVKDCVNVVHQAHSPSDTLAGQVGDNSVYKNFDAFYNPATGQVQNNNQYVDQDPVYRFDKCMASQGFPLSPAK